MSDVSKKRRTPEPWIDRLLDSPSTSSVVLFNLAALVALGLIIGAMKAAGDAALVVVPFLGLFVVSGFPWSDFSVGLDGSQSSWAATNVYFMIMTTRGAFINATLLGIYLDAREVARSQENPSALAPQDSSRRRPVRAILRAVIVLAVFGMLILPETPFGRRVRLDSVWGEAARAPLIYAKRRGDGPMFAKSGFRVAVQSLLGDPRTSHKGRRDLTELALAIERAVAIDTADSAAVEAAERDLSAALICVKNSGRRNYVGGGFFIDDMLRAELDTQERGAAFHDFIRRVGGKYTFPVVGNGCS